MNAKVLPTESEMERLKRVLNSLLWTDDVPEVGEDIKVCIITAEKPVAVKVNIQCAAHMVVVSGLLARRGFQPVTRRGRTFIVESGSNGCHAVLEIARHFWFTLRDHGLVDLSLQGDKVNPLVYCNRAPGDRFLIKFTEDDGDVRPLLRQMAESGNGCLYVTATKKRVSQAEMDQAMGQCFTPAKKVGIQLTYAKLVDYCERVLVGAEDVCEGETQIEAWRRLAT